MLGNRPMSEWIAQYSESHQHTENRLLHTLGIPMIAISILIAIVGAVLSPTLLIYAVALFVAGWIFQFVGHAFEGKPPEFFKDWRFLFVGLLWWFEKISGRA